jgi:microsomal dipeptidase-like Zn-dependent dipeptidase
LQRTGGETGCTGGVHDPRLSTTGLVLITQGLLDAGYSEAGIADIMGSNVQRLLLAQLPERWQLILLCFS